MSLDPNPKIIKKTEFLAIVGTLGSPKKQFNNSQPEDFDNVLWLGCDTSYGDVFKVWNGNAEFESFSLFFWGKRG